MQAWRRLLWLVLILGALAGAGWGYLHVRGAGEVCRVLAPLAPQGQDWTSTTARRAVLRLCPPPATPRPPPAPFDAGVLEGPGAFLEALAPGPATPSLDLLRRGDPGILIDAEGVVWRIDARLRNGAVFRDGVDQVSTVNVAQIALVDGVIHRADDGGRSWKALDPVRDQARWSRVSQPSILSAPAVRRSSSPLPIDGVTLDRRGLVLAYAEEFDRFAFAMDDDRAPVNGQMQPWLSNSWNPRDNRTNAWSRTYHKATAEEDQWYLDPFIINRHAADLPGAAALNPFSLSDGVLTITARRMPAPLAQRFAQRLGKAAGWSDRESNKVWASGVLTTSESFSQRYGVWEARIRLPTEKGAWPAFWMLNQAGGWPPEIDIIDNYYTGRNPNRLLSGGVVARNASGGPGAGFGPNDGGGGRLFPFPIEGVFHTYTVEWTPTAITYYLNGVAYWSQPTPEAFHAPMYLLLNLAIIGPGATWTDRPDETLQSTSMDIDWVRVWRRP